VAPPPLRRPWSWAWQAAAIAAIRCYQLVISPWFGPTCRFTPTCSDYCIEAIRKYGVVRGVWRGMRRLARCHPWRPGGYDPP
jgi:putative membrane protein insertion efficiency factor